MSLSLAHTNFSRLRDRAANPPVTSDLVVDLSSPAHVNRIGIGLATARGVAAVARVPAFA